MAGEATAKLVQDKAEPAAAKPAPIKEVVINLQTPVQANGEMVNKLVFRRPTGGDIMAMGDGYPIIIEWTSGRITPNPSVMGQMMSQLAAVPPSTIKSLDAEDWSTCAHALMGFFPPDAQQMRY